MKKTKAQDRNQPPGFIGYFLPALVVQMFHKNIINAKEMILLASIHSLQDEERGGCYASNTYLSQQAMVQKSQLGAMLTKLSKLGLIKVKGKTNNRVIVSYIEIATTHPESRAKLTRKTGTIYKDPLGSLKDISLASDRERESPLKSSLPKLTKSSHTKLSSRLKKTLIKHGKITTWNQKNSEDQFRLLQTKDKVSQARIDRVLKFYDANIGKDYIPIAFSAKAFRQKFMNLEAAMERVSKVTLPKLTKISKVAKSICKTMNRDEQEVKVAVQASLDGMNRLAKKFKGKRIRKQPHQKRFMDYVTREILHIPWIDNWCVQRMALTPLNALKAQVFDIDNLETRKELQKMWQEYHCHLDGYAEFERELLNSKAKG